MMKILTILAVSILVFSGLSTDAISKTNTKTILLPPPTDEYDMVIIAPQEFSTRIQPLINHKNSYGIRTFLKTTEEMYNEFDGNDKPEQIKYFIKKAIETQKINYVLLVGGLKHYIWNNPRDTINAGEEYWYVPVRYSNLIEPRGYNWYDPGFISDLYYADIYDENGNFSTWDTDNNGIYGEWNNRDLTSKNKDFLDLYPDVYVGRLACRNTNEVEVVVDKIITYELQTYGKEWYKKIIVAGGNSFGDNHGYFEGELTCNHIYERYMSEFNPIKLYVSNADSNYKPTPKNIIREVSSGCGFLFIEGHGNPGRIGTYWDENMEDKHGIVDVSHIPLLTNCDKYPIAVLGGCCNAHINISILYPNLKHIINDMFKGKWDIIGWSCPKSLCWSFVSKKNGGSVATIGFTGFAYASFQNENGDIDGNGIDDPDYVEEKHAYLLQSFFEAIDNDLETLGEVWADALNRYLYSWPAMEDWSDAKNIEAWILLGDPSLKIGGYILKK
ncbi:MAG: hypothetical protein JSV67_02840 [Thermoplasmatales archaeon]|nr:MAG: hypothetical protein JSV67_02840 [Thermoplasmatales archaeon]